MAQCVPFLGLSTTEIFCGDVTCQTGSSIYRDPTVDGMVGCCHDSMMVQSPFSTVSWYPYTYIVDVVRKNVSGHIMLTYLTTSSGFSVQRIFIMFTRAFSMGWGELSRVGLIKGEFVKVQLIYAMF